MFEPKTLPRAKSTFLLMADNIPTTNSGKEVPNATKDTPIIASGIFNWFAILIADSTKRSEPYISNIIPPTINVIEMKRE